MTLLSPLRNRDRGFTLIELTVTLLLIVIVLGFALPKLGNVIYATDLKRSVRQLRALLTVARSEATTEGIPRRVSCDIGKKEIKIQREVRDETELGDAVHYEDDNSILVHTLQLPSDVEIEDVITETGDKETSGTAYLHIGINGMISGNVIHLTKDDDRFTLLINPLTGRVTIKEGYQEEYKFEGGT
jgi:prepilin-type N-terminal cleavage/methylation domain-containing protein